MKGAGMVKEINDKLDNLKGKEKTMSFGLCSLVFVFLSVLTLYPALPPFRTRAEDGQTDPRIRVRPGIV
jgi:hypothetical protein